jgi:chemotaxis protein MotB
MSLRPRGRRKKGEEEEPANEERWMASYMDMVTVLMCMFIVLFAMSSVDVSKFNQLRASLATGFKTSTTQTTDGDTGHGTGGATPTPSATPSAKPSALQQATVEVENLIALREKMRTSLQAVGLENTVSFNLDARGLTVRLVGSETFFASNRTELTAVALSVLSAIGPVLAQAPYAVSVEGHADSRQAVAPYPTNWELSSGRATTVLRYLVESSGFAPDKIEAVGFGSARPLATGTDPASLSLNRRVDIVVLSDKEDAVRALIPQADRAIEGDAGTN